MFDADKFIQCVQEKRALWEKACKEYSDRNIRERNWNEIGEIMYTDWLKMVDDERQEKVKEMKNKWRHIRDNYLKFLNQGKSGDSTPNKKKKYVYAQALTFLLTTIEKGKTSGNVREDEREEERIDETDNEIETLPTDNVDADTNPIVLQAIQHQQCKAPTENSVNTSRNNASNLAPLENEIFKKLVSSQTETDDPDKLFLLSLVPDYKKLSSEEKLDFRLYTLQFFRDIRNKTDTNYKTQKLTPINQLYSTTHYDPLTSHSHYFPGYYPRAASAPATVANQVSLPVFSTFAGTSTRAVESGSSITDNTRFSIDNV